MSLLRYLGWTNDALMTIAPNAEAPPIFEDVAKSILQKSIRSAVCIDDKYASAYAARDNPDLNFDEPSVLYTSFRENGLCSLDIYQFETLEVSWKDYMCYGKDLLVLDWELDPGNAHDSTLKILSDVIENDKVPFVVIYTNTQDISSIYKELIRSFNSYDNSQFPKFCTTLKEKVAAIINEASSLDFEVIFDEIENLCYDYIHFYDKAEQREQLLKTLAEKIMLKQGISLDALDKKIASVLEVSSSGNSILDLSYCICNKSDTKFYIQRIHTKEDAYRINGTTILVFSKQGNKEGITPENLYSAFSKVIIGDPFNFLSLLSLELKDSLRHDFNKIGVEFASINDHAFFYHLNNYRTEEGKFDLRTIYNFLLKGWIEELHSQKLTSRSSILACLSEKFEEIKSKFPDEENIKSDDLFLKELVKYSAFISNTKIENREDSILRFGDLFANAANPDEFFLCITPLCDCVRPEKVSYNYYFVKGSKTNNYEALMEAETDYYSFTISDTVPVSIQWRTKPFTDFIAKGKNDIGSLAINYSGKNIKLRHVTFLKENYTQRISNQSFGYGYRVGIDLPHIWDEQSKDGSKTCEISQS